MGKQLKISRCQVPQTHLRLHSSAATTKMATRRICLNKHNCIHEAENNRSISGAARDSKSNTQSHSEHGERSNKDRERERGGGKKKEEGAAYFQTSCSRSAAAAAAVRREAGMGVSHCEKSRSKNSQSGSSTPATARTPKP
jgi:hypothetical protein